MGNPRVKELIEKHLNKITEHRCHIHEHPELPHTEKETAAYIAKTLREMGLEPTENVGGYGVTAMIEGNGEGKCAGLRADFDALPIMEKTGLPFASKNPGVMHACGHDVHTAMLLGAAYVLNDMRDSFAGRIKLVFQPAEEDAAACGAKAMIEDGVLENPKVDAMFGQHVWPSIDTGKIGIRDGAMMAASDRFFITVKGKNSHASRPEDGIDAIVAAAQVVTALQTIVSRNVGPLDSAVVTVGTIHGGNVYNALAEEVKLEGTCRNLNPEIRNRMPERIENIVRGVTSALGAEYEFRYLRCYSPLVNDHALYELACGTIAGVLGEENLLQPENAALGGEDFSFYCEKVPSVFFWLGCHRPGAGYHPIHHGEFVPDADAIPLGIEAMVNCALDFLAGK